VRERVVIERVPVDREVDRDAPPAVREEDGVLVVPVLEEVLVVERRLVLKEELRVSRVREEATMVSDVPLSEERVIVERVDPAEPREPGGR
jgi:stress response protein YsnF